MSTATPKPSSIFFAYAGRPGLRAETMRHAIEACKKRGLDARGWETLRVEGHILIDRITEAINSADYGRCQAV